MSSERYKGHDRIIRAMPSVLARVPDTVYLIVGSGDDQQRLEQFADETGVASRVIFAGQVTDAELHDYFALARVFAMPSTGEGFGIVFLEAMACGTPVLAGNCDGSVDALDHGRLGRLVDPTDVHAVASGIVSLLRRQGPEWWFDRNALRSAVIERFGRPAFRDGVRRAFSF